MLIPLKHAESGPFANYTDLLCFLLLLNGCLDFVTVFDRFHKENY